MPKRIDRQEFQALMATARATYKQNIEAAGRDSGKVDLAAKELSWAEEAARDAFNQRSGLYKFFDSVPLIGKPIAIILDNVDRGIDQHGRFWGSLRGLFIGVVIATALVVVSEGVPPLFDLARHWLNLHYFFDKKSQLSSNAYAAVAEKRNELYYERHPEERPGYRPPPAPHSPPEHPLAQVDREGFAVYPLTFSDRTACVSIDAYLFNNPWLLETDSDDLRRLYERAAMLSDTRDFLPKDTSYRVAVSNGAPVIIKLVGGGSVLEIQTSNGKTKLISSEAFYRDSKLPQPQSQEFPLILSDKTACVSITEDQFNNATLAETDGGYLRRISIRAGQLSDNPNFLPKDTSYRVAVSNGVPVIIKLTGGESVVEIKTSDGGTQLISADAFNRDKTGLGLPSLRGQRNY